MANKTNTKQAYCPELGRIITVQLLKRGDYTFGDKRLPAGVKQLNFQCSIEGCEAKLITHNFSLFIQGIFTRCAFVFTPMSCNNPSAQKFQTQMSFKYDGYRNYAI